MDKIDVQSHDGSPSDFDIQNAGKLSITVEGDLPSQDLQKWHDEYMATDGNSLKKDSEVLLAVNDDSLDNEAFEEEVQQFVAHVEGGFCLQCRTLFNNWPDLQKTTPENLDTTEDSKLHKEGWEHHVSAKRFRTHELEASTRQGCRFCALIRQILVDRDMLDTFRKIEGRLVQFTEDTKIALSIQNWGKFAINKCLLLWPNLPGKVCTSCNSGTALSTKFQSSVVPVPGMLLEILRDCNADHFRWLVNGPAH